MCALDVLVVVTMFQIASSLKLILNEIDVNEAKKKRRIAYILGAIYMILFCGFILVIYYSTLN